MVKYPHSLGPRACAWIENFLVIGSGDDLGKPFKLRDWQKELINDLLTIGGNGKLKYRRALIIMGKGNGKSELMSAIANFFLLGGTRSNPTIALAAGSFDQANILYQSARNQISEGPLSPYVEMTETKMYPKGAAGSLERIVSSHSTVDGKRNDIFIADEIHEWTGDRKERVHLVMSNNLQKRDQGFELNISTPSANQTDLLGRMYSYAKGVQDGSINDSTFFFKGYMADEKLDLSDPKQLEQAIKQANPAIDDFFPMENLKNRFKEIPEHEFRRYHLAQFAASKASWLPNDAWDQLVDPEEIPEGTDIVMGFDGSVNNDASALIGCTIEEVPKLFVIGIWEKPYHDQDWYVPRHEVHAAIEQSFKKYNVIELACDPPSWWQEIDQWTEMYGDKVLIYETNYRKRMVRACDKFYTAVCTQALSHDGNDRLAAHMDHATIKETAAGTYITKPSKNSPLKIDAAVGAIIAFDRATSKRDNDDPEDKEFKLITI